MNHPFPETVLVGRILRPHGLRGDVVVSSLSDVEDRFDLGKVILLAIGSEFQQRTIRRSGASGDRLLLGFDGCEDRDAAETLRGCELHVALDDVPEASEGEYYYFQLLDCVCRDAVAGEVGRVEAIVEDGGGLLLKVVRGQESVLIPFVRAMVRDIDLENGVIDLELPEGLLEACVSTS